MVVIGHRGFSARYPENTLTAFRQALRTGADGVECDVQQTIDGHYVVVHDPDLGRTVGVAGRIDLMELADIVAVAGSAGRVPTLDEVLAAVPRRRLLNIEVKADTLNRAAERLAGPRAAPSSRHSAMTS